MRNISDIAELLREYGPTYYGPETPEYAAAQWAEAFPNADLSVIHEWISQGFWDPSAAKQIFSAGLYPWEVPSSTVYDLCNGDLSAPVYLRNRL